MPNSEKVKMALSLELWNILINFCINIDVDKI